MMEGAKGIIPAVIRILVAGILAGILIEFGSASVNAETIVNCWCLEDEKMSIRA